jgi:hypothetical protein
MRSRCRDLKIAASAPDHRLNHHNDHRNDHRVGLITNSAIPSLVVHFNLHHSTGIARDNQVCEDLAWLNRIFGMVDLKKGRLIDGCSS